MAKANKGAGGFSQMPKMITDEPSVILKLKKGGSAHHKHGGKHEEHGHKPMHKAMGGMMDGMTLPARGGMAPAMAPKMGALAARRAAMKGMPTPLMKKGGKAHKAHGGEVESKAEQHREDAKMAKIEKELKHHEGMKAGKAHHGLKKGGHAKKHFAKGGSAMGKEIDSFETKTTNEKGSKKFLQTEMHDGEHHDKVNGTGMVKEGNAGGFKHGGKVHKISGHPEGSMEHHKAMAKHHAKMHKEGGSHHHHKMAEHHKAMCKGGKYAIGGTVSDNVAKKYENTMMLDGEHHDSVHGTGEVKESNAGGFKHGGKAHMKHGGKHHYAKGGSTAPDLNLKDTVEGGDWEDRPADTTKPGVRMQTTGAVKEGNGGGFKHGGKASKKHFATGGAVNKQGSAVAMPQGRKPASPPVAITRLAGTFKKGGKVKHYERGGAISDYDQRMMQFAPGQDMKNVSPQDVADAKQRAKDTASYIEASRITPRSAGAGRGFVNPPMVRKHGGRAKK
jgi:hypothetical protein